VITEGLAGLLADLVRAGGTVEGRAAAVVKDKAEKVRDTAKDIVAVDTGATRDSIEATGEGGKWEVGPTVPWGGFLEFGTVDTAPQPYMGPAADAHAGELVSELKEVAGDV
jgi:HK97 gp10 family phage protein